MLDISTMNEDNDRLRAEVEGFKKYLKRKRKSYRSSKKKRTLVRDKKKDYGKKIKTMWIKSVTWKQKYLGKI